MGFSSESYTFMTMCRLQKNEILIIIANFEFPDKLLADKCFIYTLSLNSALLWLGHPFGLLCRPLPLKGKL